MPRVTETEQAGFLHCGNPHCAGHTQEPVDCVRVETAFTYAEKGGDAPGVEHSTVHYRLPGTPEEVKARQACPGCGQARELTDRPRQAYQPISGHDPNGLLRFGPYDPAKAGQVAADKTAELERQLAEMRQMVAEMVERQAAA